MTRLAAALAWCRVKPAQQPTYHSPAWWVRWEEMTGKPVPVVLRVNKKVRP